MTERQCIVVLAVNGVLVDDDRAIIRHRIPFAAKPPKWEHARRFERARQTMATVTFYGRGGIGPLLANVLNGRA